MKKRICSALSTFLAATFAIGQLAVGSGSLSVYAQEDLLEEEQLEEDQLEEDQLEEEDEPLVDDISFENTLFQEVQSQADSDIDYTPKGIQRDYSRSYNKALEETDIDVTEEDPSASDPLDYEPDREFIKTHLQETLASRSGKVSTYGEIVAEVNVSNFADYFEAYNHYAYVREDIEVDTIVFTEDIDAGDVLDGIWGIVLDLQIEVCGNEANRKLDGIFIAVISSNVSIHDLVTKTNDEYSIYVYGSNNVSIDSVVLSNESKARQVGYGIILESSNYVSITNSFIFYTGLTQGNKYNNAISVLGEPVAKGIKINNNTIYACMPSCNPVIVQFPANSGNWELVNLTDGVFLFNAGDVDFTNNTLLYQASGVVGSINTINALSAYGSPDAGSDPEREANLIIENNMILLEGHTYAHGIYIFDCSYLIKDNYVGVSSDEYCARGIWPDTYQGGNILNNRVETYCTVENSVANGIYISDLFSEKNVEIDSLISGNEIDMQAGACFGIEWQGRIDTEKTVTISDNSILEDGGYLTGIGLEHVGNAVISGNYINAICDPTIEVPTGNDIFGMSTKGIYDKQNSEGDANVTISNNIIETNGRGIISVSKSVITGNAVVAGSDYAIETYVKDKKEGKKAEICKNVLYAEKKIGSDSIYTSEIDSSHDNIGYPETTAINAGEPLSKSVLSDGYDGSIGTFYWANPAEVPSVLDSLSTEFETSFVPKDFKINGYLNTKALVEVINDDPFFIEGIKNYNYTGSKITLEDLRVFSSGLLLKEGKDYTLTYSNNKNVGTATVKIKGIGNFTAATTVNFTISPANISTGDFSVENIYLLNNKNNKKLVPVVKWNGKVVPASTFEYTYLKEGANIYADDPETTTDYTVSHQIVIRPKKDTNFSGILAVDVKIKNDAINVSDTTITLDPNLKSYSLDDYDGPAEPYVVVKKGNVEYDEDTDYSVEYFNNDTAGKGYLVVTGLGDKLIGQKKISFTVTGRPIKNAEISNITDQTFDPSRQFEIFTSYTVKYKNTTLVEDVDYVVSYLNNDKAGTATVVFRGIGRYSGTKKATFKINKAEIVEKNEETESFVYCDGEAPYDKAGAKPLVSVFVNGEELIPGTDYTLTYSGNKKVTSEATAKVKIVGKGSYKGTVTKTFKVIQADISGVNLLGTFTEKNYKLSQNVKVGKRLFMPKITELSSGKKMVKGKDYEAVAKYYIGTSEDKIEKLVTDSDKTIKLGDYITKSFPDHNYEETGLYVAVEVTFKGNYKGTSRFTYHIADSKISSASYSIKSMEYTGFEITFVHTSDTFKEEFVIKDGSNTLEYGIDYIILEDTYKNNVKTGRATVKIKGIGKYCGTKTVGFKIDSKKIIWPFK